MDTSTIIAIISAIIGSGGVSALVTSLLSARKFRSDAFKTQQEAEGLKANNELIGADYINKQLQKISEDARKESITLRKRNDELNGRINELNDKLQSVMEWIVYDNQRYRQWLETELIKLKPDIQFPQCAPPPKIFHVDNVSEDDVRRSDDS